MKKKRRLVKYRQNLSIKKKLYTRSEEGSIQFLRVFEKVLKSSRKNMKCSLEWLSKVLQSSVKFPKSSDVVLSFLLFILFPGGKHNCLHAKSKYKSRKSTVEKYSIKGKSADSGGK